MDQRPKYKTWSHKIIRGKHKEDTSKHLLGQDFLDKTPKAQATKVK
jgi:hypothetical protein